MRTLHATRTLVTELPCQRRMFHSEADFRHAIAWRIHYRMPEVSVRYESPLKGQCGALHLGIRVTQRNGALAYSGI